MNDSGQTKLSMHIVIKAFQPTSTLKLTVECQTPAVEALIRMTAANINDDDELGAAVSTIKLVGDRSAAEFSKQKRFVLYVHDEKKIFRCVSSNSTSTDAEASSYCEEVFDVQVEKTTDVKSAKKGEGDTPKKREEDAPMEKTTDRKSEIELLSL